jgi:hypothetical protein
MPSSSWPFRRREAITLTAKPLRVIADGIMAAGHIADGKQLPVLILDTTQRPDIVHLVSAHKVLPPGDVQTQWGEADWARDTVALALFFKRPVPCECVIAFETERQGILVDLILRMGVFYLQPGAPGDRLSMNPRADKILVEVSAPGFREKWEKIFLKATVQRVRKKGLSRAEAKRAAKLLINEMRQKTSVRIAPKDV